MTISTVPASCKLLAVVPVSDTTRTHISIVNEGANTRKTSSRPGAILFTIPRSRATRCLFFVDCAFLRGQTGLVNKLDIFAGATSPSI